MIKLADNAWLRSARSILTSPPPAETALTNTDNRLDFGIQGTISLEFQHLRPGADRIWASILAEPRKLPPACAPSRRPLLISPPYITKLLTDQYRQTESHDPIRASMGFQSIYPQHLIP